MLDECFFAHLERDGVHDALALDALEAFFDDFEAGTVDHDGDAAYSRVRSDEVQERAHFGGGVEKAVVHVDVDDVGAVFDLLASNVEGFVVILFVDETEELFGSCHVAAFADLGEVLGVAAVGTIARTHLVFEQWFQTSEAETRTSDILGRGFAALVVGREFVEHLAHGGDVFRSRTAATANHVHELVVQVNSHQADHVFGRVVVTAELVRETCVRMATKVTRGNYAHAAEVRHHAVGAETAVEADGKRVHVHHAHGKCFDRLARKRTARSVAYGHRKHHFDRLDFGQGC